MNQKIIMAAAAVLSISLTAPAEAARRHYQPTAQAGYHTVTCYADTRIIPCHQSASHPDKSPRFASRALARSAIFLQGRRQAREGQKASQRPNARESTLQVNKPQEYVRPSNPNERLVMREAHEKIAGLLGNGMVRVKTAQGLYITVNPIDAAKFLKFFALLKERGYKVNPAIVGCYSPGGHKPGSNHHIGRACDIQTGWNRAPSFMYHARDLIRQAGLYDGCSFGDCGHVEAVRGLYNKRPNLYASLAKFQSDQSTANYQP